MNIDTSLTPAALLPAAKRTLSLAGEKARMLEKQWDPTRGAPVFTARGQYTARGWTEWTQGFQFGLPLLAFDGTDEADLLAIGRSNTLQRMAPHVSHTGVHDHGFNNLSTYGNLRRLMREGRIPHNEWELAFYEMAIKSSAAVQAARWSSTSKEAGGGGYLYSFNGPHSLFIDTMRSLRILGLAHQFGHVLMGENDRPVSLLERLLTHALTTARFNLYFGEGRDAYDVPALRGRTVHEAIFNPNDGNFRCPSSQQGYSPFTTWTRGLAWAILGFSEQLEFLISLPEAGFPSTLPAKSFLVETFTGAAEAAADFYIQQATAADGIPYWDTGAPALHRLGNWQSRAADPFNDHEPVDSSAAAIAAQGLLRLGRVARNSRYAAAGLTVARTLFAAPYLSESSQHQGLLLHSVYHRPNGWDYIPPERKIPCGESSMWGDYHTAELALLITRLADAKQPYYAFFDA